MTTAEKKGKVFDPKNFQQPAPQIPQKEVQQKNRPFFSVVIPCYNSDNKLKTLLQSLVDQKCTKEELEVIICDDCSTESYEDILKEFYDKLNIVKTKTDYNYCPGNTRQRGVESATGQWIIFSDHDDIFEKDVFHKVQDLVNTEKDCVLCITAFRHVDPKDTNKTIEQYVPSQGYGWTHGKFFNHDKFWKRFNFHYPKDLESHEDISITSQIMCILQQHPELKVIYADGFNTYRWVAHEDSTSNKVYTYGDDPTPRPFIDVYFQDYLKSTLAIYLEAYKNKQINRDIGMSLSLSALLFGYFYQQGNIFKNSRYILDNYIALSDYLKEIKTEFNISIIDIYNYYRYNPANLEAYYRVQTQAFNATGITIYEHTLKQWLEMISAENF